MMERRGVYSRETKETDISIDLLIDGKGDCEIKTPIPFFNHMLILMGKHGLFDLYIKAEGDVDVDDHHTIEDTGISLGKAFKDAIKDKTGIKRYGYAIVPMDEALAVISVDISNRPYLVYNVNIPKRSKIKNFDIGLIEDFFRGFVNNAGITLHINILYGRNAHHIIEAIFKGVGIALKDGVTIDKRIEGVRSTKGEL
jgi:imidazoleglycerol-phosphate dehydratase